jgi:serine/threonine protein phosphatase PrpC
MLTVETHATSHIGRVRKGNEDNYLLLAYFGRESVDEFAGSRTNSSSNRKDSKLTKRNRSSRFRRNGRRARRRSRQQNGGRNRQPKFSRTKTRKKPIRRKIYNDSLIEKLYDATVYANYLIHQQGRTDPQFQGMGATFTGIGITPEAVDLIQVGDSRAYLIRNNKIYQITKDQSLVQQLIDAGQISRKKPKRTRSKT